ncbi:MAG: hypothetical protein V3T30_07105 [Thermodesulfobacteriota bacterium]
MRHTTYDIRDTRYKIRDTIYAFCIIVLSVAAASPLYAADDEAEAPIDVTATVDKSEIHLGDRVELEVVADNVSGYEVSFPEVPERPGEFSFIESRPLKTKRGKTRAAGHAYVMSIYTTGTHVIYPIQVRYRKSGEDEWHVEESPQVPIEVKSLLTGEDTDIKDLKGLVAFGTGLFPVLLVLIAILGIAGLSWMLWRRKAERGKRETVRIKPAYEIAYEQLRQLKAMDLPGKGRTKEYYIKLSDIVRHYLEDRFSYRAPEMTTEEFMETIKKATEMLDEHKDLLKDFLSHCDMVKFARYGPTPLEILDSFRAAERLVDQTRVVEEDVGGLNSD